MDEQTKTLIAELEAADVVLRDARTRFRAAVTALGEAGVIDAPVVTRAPEQLTPVGMSWDAYVRHEAEGRKVVLITTHLAAMGHNEVSTQRTERHELPREM